jgi:hypothetical protein
MTVYNVVNMNGIAEITGDIGSWNAPDSITCDTYSTKQINVFSNGGNSTLTFSFLTGTLILPDGASYNIDLPLPLSNFTLTLSAIDPGASLFYCIVGVK